VKRDVKTRSSKPNSDGGTELALVHRAIAKARICSGDGGPRGLLSLIPTCGTAIAVVLAGPSLASGAIGDPPEATTPIVSNITTTSALFETTVNPNGAPQTSVRFEYRRQVDPPDSFFILGDQVQFTETFVFRLRGSSLQPDTDYLVRATADTANGVTTTDEVAFRTLPELPPAVTIQDVADITHVGARFIGEVDPNGTTTSYHFEYRRTQDPGWTSVPAVDADASDRGEPLPVSLPVSDLSPSTEYAVRLVASNTHGSDTSGEEIFNTLAPQPPIITRTGVSEVGTTAILRARINPNASATTYHFEYGHSNTYGTQIPITDAALGSGLTSIKVSKELGGLDANTTYHFRVVATSAAGQTASPDAIFSTRSAGSPTPRAYEMVTPAEKENADVLPGGGSTQIAMSGDGIGFLADTAFAGAPNAQGENHYLATRAPTGWSTKSIDAPVGINELHMFSLDLSKALMAFIDPPLLVPGEFTESYDLYVRDNVLDTYQLIPTQPQDAEAAYFNPVGTVWANSDLTQVVFSPNDNGLAFLPGAPKFAAYLWSDGDLSVASVLPNGAIAADARIGAGDMAQGQGTDRAISEDGSSIVFTAPHQGIEKQLYVRRNHGTPAAETVQVSAPEPGGVDPTGTKAAEFQFASKDGSKVFFRSAEKLTPESHAGTSQLYLYDFDANAGNGDLIDLTAADPSGGQVLGLIGASDQGNRVYFAARGLLDGAAVSGEPNLYLWEAGHGVTYLATLDPGDNDVWTPQRFQDSQARVTPDGRHLAFASTAQLTDFDNSGNRQIYLYDLDQDAIECASCVQGGTDSTLAAASEINGPAFEKRNVTIDGDFIFFETSAPLIAKDTNGAVDVYQYYSPTAQLSLLSGGQSALPSNFVGADADGNNALFTTRAQLVGWDQDNLVDIYDARVGGGFPEPDHELSCALDCQDPPSASPHEPSAVSATFVGPGNPRPKRCKRIENRRKRAKCSKPRRRDCKKVTSNTRHRNCVKSKRHDAASKGGRK
jgi:Tol biopolymer transport system component